MTEMYILYISKLSRGYILCHVCILPQPKKANTICYHLQPPKPYSRGVKHKQVRFIIFMVPLKAAQEPWAWREVQGAVVEKQLSADRDTEAPLRPEERGGTFKLWALPTSGPWRAERDGAGRFRGPPPMNPLSENVAQLIPSWFVLMRRTRPCLSCVRWDQRKEVAEGGVMRPCTGRPQPANLSSTHNALYGLCQVRHLSSVLGGLAQGFPPRAPQRWLGAPLWLSWPKNPDRGRAGDPGGQGQLTSASCMRPMGDMVGGMGVARAVGPGGRKANRKRAAANHASRGSLTPANEESSMMATVLEIS